MALDRYTLRKVFSAVAGIGLVAVGLLIGLVIWRPATEAADTLSDRSVPDGIQVWTCAMHPQIRSPRPGLCPICHMQLVPVQTGPIQGQVPNALGLSQTALRLMDVEVMPVRRIWAARQVHMFGKVEYDQTRLATVSAWVPGRLERVYVQYLGVEIRQGQPLFELYSPMLIAAQEELLQANQAHIEILSSNLDLMRNTAYLTLDAARQKLRLWGLSDEQIAQIASSGRVMDRVAIVAPIGGTVIERNAFEGMYVQEGSILYRIADLSVVWVMLDAYESDLVWLRTGQKAAVALADGAGRRFEGIVAFIDPVLDQGTRTAKVRLVVPNPDGALRVHAFVHAVVESALDAAGNVVDPNHAAEPPLVIPASAPLLLGDRAVVYVKAAGSEMPTFEGRYVEIGPRAGDLYLVKGGLSEGELVVVKGGFMIDSELQIQTRPSRMGR